MCYSPKDDFIYDHNKSRAENYLRLRKSVEEDADPNSLNESWKNRATRFLEGFREYKGAHLNWNYTEMVRDLIDQGLVKVPISDIEVIFVEWAAGNLDNVKREFKYEKAWFDWDGKEWPGCNNLGKYGNTHWWNKRCDLQKEHFYNDSNREEYISTPAATAQPAVSEQPTPVQYGGNQYIVPAQQQHKSWIPNVDYVDPNFIPEWERELMMKEAMMGAQGRALMQQMGMVPQYQPPRYQTVQPLPQQPLRFTSPEQVVSYILANQPGLVYDQITDESINNALEGTFIGVDE